MLKPHCFVSCLLLVFSLAFTGLRAQIPSPPAPTATITGTITDPQGAVMPQATVTLTPASVSNPAEPSANQPETAPPVSVQADSLGRYTASGLAAGRYRLEASAPGFGTTVRENVDLNAAAPARVNLVLAIETAQQNIEVSAADAETSPEKNGSAITIKGKDIEALADDPDALQSQLSAIAGSDSETGAQFYVDGFSGGRLPPKSSIREIRINQNPYSAQWDDIGSGRIEIFTKPGTDKLHGGFWTQGNNSPWNAKNPFVTSQPPYHSWFYEGDINGPISKQSSYFANIFGIKAVDNGIVNAIVLNSAFQPVPFTQAVTNPTSFIDFGPRVDYQLGKSQTISVRYHLQRNSQTNAGVGQFNLATQAYNTTNTEQTLQFSDTQAYGAHLVNETRFQYIRDRNNQLSVDQSPTVSVQGAFTGGGNSIGSLHDNQDHYEFQNYAQYERGKHDMNFGVRVRAMRYSNSSTANFNGQYTFNSLTAYQITQQGLANGLSAAQIRAAGGGPSQFLQTRGTPSVSITAFDLGVYAEDNFKLNKQLTLSYGLRFESQDHIHDHADFGPRLGAAWAVPAIGKAKPAKAAPADAAAAKPADPATPVIGGAAPGAAPGKAPERPPFAIVRPGFGLFYERFDSNNVLQAQRQNGVTETEIIVNNPDFFPNGCDANCAANAASSTPTIYRLGPKLRAPYILMAGVEVDKPVAKIGNFSVNYRHTQGQHLYLTRNANAPLPGTYNPADPTSGTRPLGINENLYEYDSEGASDRDRVTFNADLHPKHAGIFAYYSLSSARSNISGTGSFPSNSYNLHQDYGRSTYVHSRAFIGDFVELPGHISFNSFIVYQSGTPFNITTGTDLNGDSIFNDRPAFATDLTRPSVVKTRLGNFDTSPLPGQTIIPINYGTGPSVFILNARLNRSFQFGPVVKEETPPDAPKPPAPKPGAKVVKKPIERKYQLGFGVNSNNVLNHVNLAPPIGILTSPLFGKSNALANVFSNGNASANRTINLDVFFHF